MEPGPGGDPIRNPLVLPTGKNIHALDPQSIPTQAALKSARVVVERYALAPYVPTRPKSALAALLVNMQFSLAGLEGSSDRSHLCLQASCQHPDALHTCA